MPVMRAVLAIPPAPDRLRAPSCLVDAIAARERFVRGAAEAWARAGDTITSARLRSSADALATRFQGSAQQLRGTADRHREASRP